MRSRFAALAFCFVSLLALAQNSGNALSQEKQEEQFQIRQQNFTSGRQLLLDKGVPFNPDDLLRDDWATRLKPTLDAMPEMHQSRFETAPLSGAYLADTVYLPEKVQLSGHTLILANYVVFEGRNPVIRGNFDLHFFPAKPVVVLGTTLTEALGKKAGILNVKYAGNHVLPSFSLIQDLANTGPHNITFDVSGPPPQSAQRAPQKPAPKMQDASWSGLVPPLLPFQTSKNCSVSCDNPGGDGATGEAGSSPPLAATGSPNGGSPAPNGSCAPNQSPNGVDGEPGGGGAPGNPAGDGGVGGTGGNAGNINVQIALNDPNQYTFTASGGIGGTGGTGGAGGPGGNGGAGQPGGNGVACNCNLGNGGAGGQGGPAGQGGKGGTGGNGGPGGNGGNITGEYPYNGPVPNTGVAGGKGGTPGTQGAAGPAGTPGPGGQPGSGATACGVTASQGNFLGPGAVAGTQGPGKPGQSFGAAGTPGTVNLQPYGQPIGGGGGGGPNNPCDDISTAPVQTIDQCNGSPIIIDVAREGFHLTSVLTGVTFDISGTGHPVQMGWTDAHYHNAFLALPGADGLVHTGKELFGNFTPQPPSQHPNGFIALAQYDKPENGGNGDGIIDDRDEVFSKLRLWIDENHDGVCQPNELHRLPEFGVYSLAVTYTESRRTDEWGNQFRYKAIVNPGERKDPRDQTPAGDPGRWTYDVFFVTK